MGKVAYPAHSNGGCTELSARERKRKRGGANKLSNDIASCAMVRVRERESEER